MTYDSPLSAFEGEVIPEVYNLQNWDHKLFVQTPALCLQPFELAYLFLLLPLDFFQTIRASFLNISK